MLRLKPYEACSYTSCPCQTKLSSEVGYCQGMNSNRSHSFECEFVSENGRVDCNVYRTPIDQTGKMVLLQELDGVIF